MKSTAILLLVLMLTVTGCVTIKIGGGGSEVPKVVQFTVSPNSINPGDASILSWEVEDASSVSIEPGIPSATSIGIDKVVPASTTSYVLTATNKYGTTTATALLTVGGTDGIATAPIPGTPMITSFTATPTTVSAGNPVVLTWNTVNSAGARISGVGNVATSGTQIVYPPATITYILEAYTGSNSTSSSAMVVVTSPGTPTPASPPPSASSPLPTILSFTASPSSVTSGGSTVLTWSTVNATSASITDHGAVPVSGSLMVYPSGTGSRTFSLTATNAAGSSYASTAVLVSSAAAPPPPPSTGSRPMASLYVSPSSIASGDWATLSWITSGATSINIDNGVKSLVGITGASGSTTVSPTSTTTYILTATNAYGSTYVSQVLTVAAAPIPYIPPPWPTINKFRISDTTVMAGTEVTLWWNVSDADNIYVDNGIGSVAAESSTVVRVWVTTTFTLTASNAGNTVAQSVTVIVP